MMVLNGAEIKSRKLVQNAADKNFRNASYDLRIAKILAFADQQDRDAYVLRPQGLVEVISAERVELPANVIAYAMVKTTLCNEGIFAINIGIVDPGYGGLISSTLVNLGKMEYLLKADQPFLRLVFHEFKPQSETAFTPVDDATYLSDKRTKVRERFSETFLDIPATVERLAKPVMEELFGEWKKTLFIWVPLAAVLLAGLAFLVNWGATSSARYALLDRDIVRREVLSELRISEQSANSQRLQQLENRIGELTTQMNELRGLVSPPAAPRRNGNVPR